ncbi:MAG: shikimate kinase [Bacteroidota bacterium]
MSERRRPNEANRTMLESPPHRHLIFLAGFMGSGKSTIGPILANTLGFDFVDIDRRIEAVEGKSVSEIFFKEGEAGFRRLERRLLEEIAGRDHCVVSLGGGTIASEEIFDLIRRNGILVYLQLPPGEIFKRVQHKTNRPMLKDGEGNLLPADLMQERIDALLKRREEFYRQADVTISTEKKRVGITVDEIVRKLSPLLKRRSAS